MFRKRTRIALLLMGTLAVPVAFVGCGADCGLGTMERNGQCVPRTSPLTCGPGTEEVDGACVPIGGGGDGGPDVRPDSGPEPDGPAKDEGPKVVPCDDGCGPGLQCNQATNTCVIVPGTETKVEVVRPNDNYMLGADPTFSVENGRLMMYFILGGGFEGNPFGLPDALALITDGRKRMQGVLSAGRVEINPETLERVADPDELLEFACPTITPAVSPDGLWIAYTCPRFCYGQTEPGFDDICVANRKSVDEPFTNFRVLTSISSPRRYERDPAWTYDQNGRINGIIWVANPGNDPIGGTNAEICRAPFDPDAPTTCIINPMTGETGDCTGVADNPMENGEPACRIFNGAGSTIVASDPFSAETCPEFTANMRYFSFGRSGQTTTLFDLFLAGSSKRDGVLDEWYGALTGANSNQHDFGIGIAPPPFGNIVAWTRANDIVFFSDTNILLGRLPIKAGE